MIRIPCPSVPAGPRWSARIAELAANRLSERIGGDVSEPIDHLLMPSLVSRPSTIPYPTDRKERRHAC